MDATDHESGPARLQHEGRLAPTRNRIVLSIEGESLWMLTPTWWRQVRWDFLAYPVLGVIIAVICVSHFSHQLNLAVLALALVAGIAIGGVGLLVVHIPLLGVYRRKTFRFDRAAGELRRNGVRLCDLSQIHHLELVDGIPWGEYTGGGDLSVVTSDGAAIHLIWENDTGLPSFDELSDAGSKIAAFLGVTFEKSRGRL